MIGCKVMRTLASVEIEIILILGLPFCHSNSSSVRCLKNVVPVSLPKDPYEALRQAYLVGTNTESEPFEDPVETETLESPHIVAPPTCHVEESEGSGTSDVRSMSSDSIASLSPDHPLTHTTLVLVPYLCRTARMAVRVLSVMSPSLSVSIAEVAAMPNSAFRKRFRSFYDSSPSSTFPVRKRYRDSYSKSEDAKDEGPTVEDKDHAAKDGGLAARDEGADMGVKSLGLGWDEAVPEGSERQEIVSALMQPILTTWIDSKDGIAYINVPAYPPPAPPVRTPLSPEWSSDLLPISPAPSIVPSPILSPMISLTVPSSIASPTTAKADGFWAEFEAQEQLGMRSSPRDIDLKQEQHEMRGRVTALEQERDRRERRANRKVGDHEWSWGILERVAVIKLET
nr:hypothetical protein [Tanacetum cinerariifolium]